MAGRRRLVIEATMDAKGVKTGAKQVESSTSRMGKSVTSSAGAVKTAMGVVAAGAVVAFGKEMVQHAAVLESIEQRTKTVFGNAAGNVERWAADSASAMGMSALSVQNLANELGDLLIPLGISREEAAEFTKESLNAANALSEWTGGQVSVEEAASAVTKAMLGEREELKKLGIKIGEADIKQALLAKGQQNLEGDALAAAKAIATQELILGKSADALAAYAEGGNEALQAQKDLASQVGELKDGLSKQLAPALNKVVDGLGAAAAGAKVIMDWFNDLDPTAKNAALAIAGVTAALALVYANPVVAGLALVAGAIIVIGKKAEEAEQKVQDFKDAMSEGGFGEELIAEEIGGGALSSLEELGFSLEEINTALRGSQEEWLAFFEAAKEATGGSLVAMDPAVLKLQQMRFEVQDLTGEMVKDQAAADEMYESFAEGAKDHAFATKAAADYADATDDTTEALTAAEQAQRDLTSAIHSSVSKVQRARDAQAKYEEVLERVTEDEVITADEALDLAAAIADVDQTAADVSTQEYSQAMGAARSATADFDGQLGDVQDKMIWLNGRRARATATVTVNSGDLGRVESAMERFNRITSRTIKVSMKATGPSQDQINRKVLEALRRAGIIPRTGF